MDKLWDEIFMDLQEELNLTSEQDKSILSSKIKNAIREVRRTRNYQVYHSEDFVCADIGQFYSNIRELALYDFNQIGAEGEISHSENGTSRAWKDRNDCFNGIVAFCTSF